MDLAIRLSIMLPKLNEKQRRELVAVEAMALGHGGIKKVSEITEMSRNTIARGLNEIAHDEISSARIRIKGGGRKKVEDKFPEIFCLIEEIIEPETRGDPESPLRWTCKSVRNIASLLNKKGYSVKHDTVARILKKMNYSLQANRKTTEGKIHPDRNAQFVFINNECRKFIASKNPAISVDTKKKELVGNYKNQGREWRKKQTPRKVKTHDFPDKKIGKANPYGVYDIGKNSGFVNIGITSDTAEFAVSSIKYWWRFVGKKHYSKSKKILICADAGGSNGYRSRLWKRELQKLSNSSGLNIVIRHFPTGTSKWNKIEHRLFSFITSNWRGQPLTTYQTIINLIASTKTKTGLTVKARLDKKEYVKGIEVSDEEMENLNLVRDKFHGEWNYIIKPLTSK